LSSNAYQTNDLILASYLKHKGLNLASYKKDSKGRVTFHFEASDEDIQKLVVQYLNSEERAFYDELKALKRLT
jgi:hypothetical protein